MKFGMNLLLYTTNPDDSIFPICEKLQAMGYDGLEWPILGISKEMATKVGEFNRKIGLGATAVSVLSEDENPLSDDPAVREKGLAGIRERLELAKLMNVEYICGPLMQPLGWFTGQPVTKAQWANMVSFLKEAGEIAAGVGVGLVLEPINRFEIFSVNTSADCARLCADVDHPSVKMMLDSFHMNIEEKDVRQAFRTAKPHLAHVHVSENDRGVPGSSRSIRWDDFFGGAKEVGYDGWMTIEAFSSAMPDLAAAARIWRPLFDDADKLCSDGLLFMKKLAADPASAT
ncbi:D-tagatose 3-epimerase [Planctomycetes bacterium Pan216]|uniref:D-tagatose 3-epimerase n=1 Tax=Kolteria novifilia TaxID=2527975 RepID=A0A518BB29_9BACT|nr:D-tagatose 3-epimerase [Planctomycetes bacterium Pan216]